MQKSFFRTLPHLTLVDYTGSPDPISRHWLKQNCCVGSGTWDGVIEPQS